VKSHPILILFVLLLSLGLAGCTAAAPVTPTVLPTVADTATALPTDPPATASPTTPPTATEPPAAALPSETPTLEPDADALADACVDCHTDKDKLTAAAKVEEPAEAESKGVG